MRLDITIHNHCAYVDGAKVVARGRHARDTMNQLAQHLTGLMQARCAEAGHLYSKPYGIVEGGRLATCQYCGATLDELAGTYPDHGWLRVTGFNFSAGAEAEYWIPLTERLTTHDDLRRYAEDYMEQAHDEFQLWTVWEDECLVWEVEPD